MKTTHRPNHCPARRCPPAPRPPLLNQPAPRRYPAASRPATRRCPANQSPARSCPQATHRPAASRAPASRPAILTLPLALALLICSAPHLPAQYPQDWSANHQHIDATPYQCRKFRLTAAIRSQCMDPRAGAELYVRVDKNDKTMGFFYNMMDKPIRDTQWKVYTIEGRIDKNAKNLFFGPLYQRKGYFWFDDFHLSIETRHNQWTSIPLSDAGFEEEDTAVLHRSWVVRPQRPFFTINLSDENPYEGKRCLKIDGSNFKNPDTYGSNDTAGHYVVANGIKLYYEVYGHGQPLLLLHGNSESIVSFNKQIPDLAKQYQVIAVDTRGQGRSTEDGKTYTYDLFAQDMNALLDTLRLDSVDVLGWSDGGNTGLIMAMNYPKKVRRLAAMGANIFIDHTVVAPWVFRQLEKEKRSLAADTTREGENRIRLINLLLTEPRHKFEDLQTIQCPVLIMAGEKDVIREGHTRQIAAHIPHSRLLIFPNGTHEEPAEHPDVFNKAVLDFLSSPQ